MRLLTIQHLSTGTTRGLAQQVLRLRCDVASNIMLHLNPLGISVRAVSVGWPSFARLTDVLVISNCLLSKATQDIVLVF